MREVLLILFATGFTYAVCLQTGRILLRLLRAKLSRPEEYFFGFVAGSAGLSTIVFGLTAAGLAHTWVFLGTGAALIALSVWVGRTLPEATAPDKLEAIPAGWGIAFGGLYAIFGVLYLVNALVPEASADGTLYHVALPARYLREHRFPRITSNMMANLSEGVELLFLFAFAFGRHSAAAMVHLLYTLITPFGMFFYGRRIGSPAAGVAGALLFFLSPIVGKSGASAYTDVAVACILFTVFYLLEIWRQQRQNALLIPIGLLAGFAYAAKYTGFLAVPYAAGFVAYHLWRDRQSFWRPVMVVGLCALAMMAPWMIKNTIVVANPFYPFANRYFPNPYLSLPMEKRYAQVMRELNGVKMREIPLEATLRGFRLQGLTGPVFLLTPLMLLALRDPAGRRLVSAALVFSLPYPAAIAARFLVPFLPFVSLALALALARWRAALVTITLLHALASWPGFLRLYSDRYAWRIQHRIPWKAALRIQPESEFLSREPVDYRMGLLLEKTVPAGEPVFAFETFQQSYQSHPILVEWQSAFCQRLADALRTPFTPELSPIWRHEFRFPETAVRKIRLVEQRRADEDEWSITELRVFRDGMELPRAPEWRVKASHNPWSVQLAFDNNPITRWTSGQPYMPGMFVQLDFGRPERIDRVVAECSRDQDQMRMRLELESAPGKWEAAAEASLSVAPAPARLRRAAIEYLKANGVRWLLLRDSDPRGKDLRDRGPQWGITLAASLNDWLLYRCD